MNQKHHVEPAAPAEPEAPAAPVEPEAPAAPVEPAAPAAPAEPEAPAAPVEPVNSTESTPEVSEPVVDPLQKIINSIEEATTMRFGKSYSMNTPNGLVRFVWQNNRYVRS